MNSIRDIDEAIRRLSPTELAAFRAWFSDFDAEIWDRQFENDVLEGKLDTIAQDAVKQVRDTRAADH